MQTKLILQLFGLGFAQQEAKKPHFMRLATLLWLGQTVRSCGEEPEAVLLPTGPNFDLIITWVSVGMNTKRQEAEGAGRVGPFKPHSIFSLPS